ncbi:2-polyprenylphenol 6-hydroxylase [Rickettsia endosymbiont of Halotydeus destructor]|uniref:2-polyprenylphenol 6-hydroxylase n=1 Tax=Rickettsia endosymbiont of Halotydeus destructor TaxID=2996754 RepID=UPI003BB106E2
MNIFFNLLHILRSISKEQILIYPGNIKIPLHIKIIGYILTLIFSPLSLIKKPREDFGKRLTNCLQQLGPIYIKFGQTLSTRPDLVGLDVTKHLKFLQDKLPPFDSRVARGLVQKAFQSQYHSRSYQGHSRESGNPENNSHPEFISGSIMRCGKLVQHDKEKLDSRLRGNDIKRDENDIEHFDDTPIAAASISQVHKAQLITGEFVAIKILRPDIHQKYNRDIKLLYFLAKLASKFTKLKRLKPLAVIRKFRETMKHELDLRLEAAAASELTDNFRNDLDICIPKIYWQFTSENILTTEWVDGISIYETHKLKELGLNLSVIAQKFAVMFFNQAYRDGFFHADLHPGNILVNEQGKIILLDFGIMGRLTEKDRLAVAESLFGFLNRDYKLVAKTHLKAGYIPANTDLDLFAQSCRAVTEPIVGLATKNISVGKLLAHLFKITEDFGMEVQPQLLLLQKTLVMVEGIGQQLDTNVNMWQLAEPWIQKWAAKNLSPEAKILRIVKHYIEELYNKIEGYSK